MAELKLVAKPWENEGRSGVSYHVETAINGIPYSFKLVTTENDRRTLEVLVNQPIKKWGP